MEQIKSVKDYLDKNGYPFEMKVAKQFNAAGFEIYQSSLYVDQETGKDREIDIAAYYSRNYANVQFSFKVIIECKHAQTPWILFSGENPGFEDLGIDYFYCSNFAGRELLKALSDIPSFAFGNPFGVNSRMSYGLTEVAKKEDNQEGKNSYKAMKTLINALKHERTADTPAKGNIFEIFIPVIAVKGKLFECYLDSADNEVINEVQEGRIAYKSNVYPGVFPLIGVVTHDAIGDFAKKLFNDFDRIYKDHYGEIAHLIKTYPTEFKPAVG